MNTPSFKEDHISQIPALQFLQNIGYSYVSPEEADRMRGGKTSNVILEEILHIVVQQAHIHQFLLCLVLP